MKHTEIYPIARTSGVYVLLGTLGYYLSDMPGWLLPVGGIWLLTELFQILGNRATVHPGVLQLLRPISLLTMWVAPAASYVLSDADWYSGYRLWTPAQDYFRLAAPGTVALLWGLHLYRFLPDKPAKALPPQAPVFFWILLAIGLLAQALLPLSSGYLRYPVYLCSLLVWPALMLGIRLWPDRRWLLVSAGIVYGLAQAVQSTFFGSAVLWSMALWAFPTGPPNKSHVGPLRGLLKWRNALNATNVKPLRGLKLIAMGVGAERWRDDAILSGLALLVLFLVSFKYDYREQKAAHPDTPGLFFRMAADKLRQPASIFHPEVLSRTLSRFNQRFHTAQAMAYVPSQTPFVYGETLLKDIWSALVPRILDPDKHRAGGKENLRRFAGQAHYRISANIGIFGEAYVNFGTTGAWLVLLLYGALLGLLWQISARYVGAFWGPYLFLPAVHVESDIGIVFNHICKSALVALIITLLWHGFTHFRRRTHAE